MAQAAKEARGGEMRRNVAAATSGAFVVLAIVGCGLLKRPPAFERFQGTWDWADKADTCRGNPFTVAFHGFPYRMRLTYREPIDGPNGRSATWEYDVRRFSPKLLEVSLVDPPETRRNAAGELLVWQMFLVEDNAFVWIRTDMPDKSTKRLVRCANAQ